MHDGILELKAAQSMTTPLSAFPGLGPKSQAMLTTAGIESIEGLKRLGAVQAYVMVKRNGCKPSLNLLWGLESAISGIPWQEVARVHRASLLIALDEAESSSSGLNDLKSY